MSTRSNNSPKPKDVTKLRWRSSNRPADVLLGDQSRLRWSPASRAVVQFFHSFGLEVLNLELVPSTRMQPMNYRAGR